MKRSPFTIGAALLSAGLLGNAAVTYTHLREQQRTYKANMALTVNRRTRELSANAMAHDGLVVETHVGPQNDSVAVSRPYPVALYELRANAEQAVERHERRVYSFDNISRTERTGFLRLFSPQ